MYEREKILKEADDVFSIEISTLIELRKKMGEAFVNIVESIHECSGKCIVCGMGKSGHIARKISATLSSLGTPAFFLHPAEAVHGDLGIVTHDDVVILLSNSGETSEIVSLIPSLKQIGVKLIGVTGNKLSTLAKESDLVQIIEVKGEAGHLKLAPTVSTTAMLVYGDALAVTLSDMSGFSSTDFAKYHPAGTLGKKALLRVHEIMAKKEDIPVVLVGTKITEAILEMSKKGLGVVSIVDRDNRLRGILTDGDLRRAIEKGTDFYNGKIEEIMTSNPKSIKGNILLVDALTQLKESHLNNYPVVNENNIVIGMLTWQMIIRAGVIL